MFTAIGHFLFFVFMLICWIVNFGGTFVIIFIIGYHFKSLKNDYGQVSHYGVLLKWNWFKRYITFEVVCAFFIVTILWTILGRWDKPWDAVVSVPWAIWTAFLCMMFPQRLWLYRPWNRWPPEEHHSDINDHGHNQHEDENVQHPEGEGAEAHETHGAATHHAHHAPHIPWNERRWAFILAAVLTTLVVALLFYYCHLKEGLQRIGSW